MTEIQQPQPPAKERKHSPHCRRHEHHQNRRHRRHQQEQQQQQRQDVGDYEGGGGYQVGQPGLYSVDVEYGYNYTRVGRKALYAEELILKCCHGLPRSCPKFNYIFQT